MIELGPYFFLEKCLHSMALGSLINKSSAPKRAKSAEQVGDLASIAEDDGGTEPALEKAKTVKQPERKPDMTKSVLALDMNLKSGSPCL